MSGTLAQYIGNIVGTHSIQFNILHLDSRRRDDISNVIAEGSTQFNSIQLKIHIIMLVQAT